jgi:hypothetical protein
MDVPLTITGNKYLMSYVLCLIMATSLPSLLLFLLSEWQVEDMGILVRIEQGGTKGAFCSMMPTDEKGVSVYKCMTICMTSCGLWCTI